MPISERRKRTPAPVSSVGRQAAPSRSLRPLGCPPLGLRGGSAQPGQRARAPPTASSQLPRLLSEGPPQSPRPASLRRLWQRSPQGGQVPPADAGWATPVVTSQAGEKLQRCLPGPPRLPDAISRVAHNSERGRDTSAALPGTAATASAAANPGGEPQARRGQGRGHAPGRPGSGPGRFPGPPLPASEPA